MRTLFAMAVMVLNASSSTAQPAAPTGVAPTLKIVSKIDKEKGEMLFEYSVSKPVAVSVEKDVVVNGITMKVVETELKFVTESRVSLVKVSDSRVITTDGKQLPIEEIWKRINKGSVVAISGNNDTPAPAYLRALNPQTLIVIPGIPAPLKK